jgi:hypothetical protein
LACRRLPPPIDLELIFREPSAASGTPYGDVRLFWDRVVRRNRDISALAKLAVEAILPISSPGSRKVSVNPSSPNILTSLVKGLGPLKSIASPGEPTFPIYPWQRSFEYRRGVGDICESRVESGSISGTTSTGQKTPLTEGEYISTTLCTLRVNCSTRSLYVDFVVEFLSSSLLQGQAG